MKTLTVSVIAAGVAMAAIPLSGPAIAQEAMTSQDGTAAVSINNNHRPVDNSGQVGVNINNNHRPADGAGQAGVNINNNHRPVTGGGEVGVNINNNH